MTGTGGVPGTPWTALAVARVLRSSTALSELDEARARLVASRMRYVEFPANTEIFREHAFDGTAMVLLLEGEVMVEKAGLKRSECVMLGVLRRGEIVGEMAVLDGEPRSATCRTVTVVKAASLARKDLQELMESQPDVASRLLASMLHRTSARLRHANQKLMHLRRINRSLSELLPT